MIGLKLRDEFLASRMPGTIIRLSTIDKQGAAQKPAEQILSITYPTADVLTALKSISTKRNGCPIVLMGDRGRGKSHIMAVMHHAIESPHKVELWLKEWSTYNEGPEFKDFEMVKGYFPISEPVQNQEYPLLWDILFERHPKGSYFRGQFESKKQPYPPRTLLEKMFEDTPTCLILDEFQKWYDGLHNEPGDEGIKYKTWAENFIQNLSEIAKDRPDILILVISVLNNTTDAFQQVHRQGPVVIDFRGPSAKQDRQKLLLHRLFENRRNIPEADIFSIASTYANERFRLVHINKSESEKDKTQQETFACWPFSPELLDLLENHILLSIAAQETRDMMRILALLFRSRGDLVPVLTPADFFVDGETDEVQTLVDSISSQVGQEKLRQIAQHNLESIHESGVPIPHARELLSAIWMRSLSPGKTAGGKPAELHLDITRDAAFDDNSFQAELALLIENSVNLHGDEFQGGRISLSVSENPRSKVRACAKNNKLWDINAIPTAGMTIYPGKDISHIRKTLLHIFVPETSQPPSRVIILGSNWKTDPWSEVEDIDKPLNWERPVLLVIPDQIAGDKVGINQTLGIWLAKHVLKRRNTVRFLLLASDAKGIFSDDELIYSTRCSFLCSAGGWGGSDITYKALMQDFDRPLRTVLKSRFNRVAVLRKWDFQQPQNCVFDIEKITEQGGEIPTAVEAKIQSDLFDPNGFKLFVIERAKDSDVVGSLMDDLIEPPPPNSGDTIPFLGETKIYENILSIAANGDIFLNVGGTWYGRRSEDGSNEDALRYLRSKAFRTGQEMRQVQLGLPGTVGGGTVTGSPSQPSTVQPVPVVVLPAGAKGDGNPYIPPVSNPETNENGENGNTSPVNLQETKNKKTLEPATSINLSGRFEAWEISPNQIIDSTRIEFLGLTALQIKQILSRIPSTYLATIDVTYKEGGQE